MTFKQQLRSLIREQRDRFRRFNQSIGAYIRFPGDRPGHLISQNTSYRTDLIAVVVGENPLLRSLSRAEQPLNYNNFLS